MLSSLSVVRICFVRHGAEVPLQGRLENSRRSDRGRQDGENSVSVAAMKGAPDAGGAWSATISAERVS